MTDELKVALQTIWEELSQELIGGVENAWPEYAVLENDGP